MKMRWFSKPVHSGAGVESRLLLFVAYLCFLVYLFWNTRSWATVLYVHIGMVFIFSIYYFGREFLFIAVAPLTSILIPINEFRTRRILKKYPQNISSEVAVILAYSNWKKLEAWVKPNFFPGEIRTLISYLEKRKQNFSFYPRATLSDVESIMRDKNIKEVYFYGHGSSHVFQLSTDDILYYCEFNRNEHGKEFVHQMHCGTSDGKSLSDYVVPQDHKSECYLVRKSITALDIERDLKNKIALVASIGK